MLVDNVQTKEGFGGRGYGTELMNKAVGMAEELKIDSVELVVNRNNKIAG